MFTILICGHALSLGHCNRPVHRSLWTTGPTDSPKSSEISEFHQQKQLQVHPFFNSKMVLLNFADGWVDNVNLLLCQDVVPWVIEYYSYRLKPLLGIKNVKIK